MVFGTLTIITIICLPKLNHIVTVVPSMNLSSVRELEKEFNLFINNNNRPVVFILGILGKTPGYWVEGQLGWGF